jgi:hypothetical protein
VVYRWPRLVLEATFGGRDTLLVRAARFLVIIVIAAVSYPVPRKRERSLHTCAQDVQITRMATI